MDTARSETRQFRPMPLPVRIAALLLGILLVVAAAAWPARTDLWVTVAAVNALLFAFYQAQTPLRRSRVAQLVLASAWLAFIGFGVAAIVCRMMGTTLLSSDRLLHGLVVAVSVILLASNLMAFPLTRSKADPSEAPTPGSSV